MRASLVDAIQHRVAVVAIGPSTARSQGAAGVVKSAQLFLATLSLTPFGTNDPVAFRSSLDEATLRLRNAFPKAARSWGLARKCVNIFVRDACYNHYLRAQYALAHGEILHEVPLDSVVAKELRREMPKGLTRWPGVRHLTPHVSEEYQEAAAEVANRFSIARVHLDTYLWVQGRGA